MPAALGRYEILEEVGRGSMGVVYKARDPRIGRVLALKTIAFSFPLGPGEEQEFLQRFYHEAQVAGRLNHPHIVTIHDVGEKGADGDAYIAMEFVTGTNLQDLLAGGGRLPLAHVADVMEKLAQALDYAHENGVIHRDIKPANIVLTEAGQPKILDFGIARMAAGGHTRPGRFFGTPNYMSPEQVTGSDVDGRTDQFSLAVILYQLLTGEKPFAGESVTAISYQVVNVDPPPPSRLNPSLRPAFDRVIRKALAKRVADRYGRCAELAADLRAAVEEWRNAADEATPPTLVSAARGEAPSEPSPRQGGVRGITFLAPRWTQLLPLHGERFRPGWIGFLVCLALLAAAPFLLQRPGPRRPAGAQPFGVLTTPWDPGGRPADGGGAPPAVPEGDPARLRVSFTPRFGSGRVYVRVDGRSILDEAIRRPAASRRAWMRTLQVPAGKHRVEVRVVSADKVYDEIEGIETVFRSNETKHLRLSFTGLSKRLRLRFDEPGAAPR